MQEQEFELNKISEERLKIQMSQFLVKMENIEMVKFLKITSHVQRNMNCGPMNLRGYLRPSGVLGGMRGLKDFDWKIASTKNSYDVFALQ